MTYREYFIDPFSGPHHSSDLESAPFGPKSQILTIKNLDFCLATPAHPHYNRKKKNLFKRVIILLVIKDSSTCFQQHQELWLACLSQRMVVFGLVLGWVYAHGEEPHDDAHALLYGLYAGLGLLALLL